MRSVSIVTSNLGFMSVVDIRFDDVPDEGPQSQIAQAFALTQEAAIEALKKACGPNGEIAKGKAPNPVVQVYDEPGLKSLDARQWESYKVVEGYSVKKEAS